MMCFLVLLLIGLKSFGDLQHLRVDKRPLEAVTMTQTQYAAAHSTEISNDALDQLFRQARTHSAWLPKRVPAETLREAYELARMGPTSANSTPARFVFLESKAAKARLVPALAPLNQCRKNESSAGHRHCRVGHRILREHQTQAIESASCFVCNTRPCSILTRASSLSLP
jgi:hypothetical protein